MPATLPSLPAKRITEDALERKLYARDLASVPSGLIAPFFKTLPDAVIRPGDARQVAEVMRQAASARAPVTPRAAASSALYSSVPVRGGWVLDMNDLRGGIELDTTRQTFHVLPATTWSELDDALRLEGFTTRSYPSSAISATVGGWISLQGHGLGSLKYGAVGAQLVSLQVVLPNGKLVTLTRDSNPPLDWFVGAEGTLGVITQVELQARPLPESESSHLLAFDDLAALGQTVVALSQTEPRPFTLAFADSGYLRLRQRGQFEIPLDLPLSAFPISEKSILLVNYQGEQAEVGQGREALVRLPGRELSANLAQDEWNLRLYHLRTKRAGPSLLAAEMWLPLNALTQYLASVRTLAERGHLLIGSHGFAVGPEWALVTSLYPTDERHPEKYLPALMFTKWLQDLGARCGGRPYGVGLFNTAYLSRLFSRARLRELKRRKAWLDPFGIMNPGKLYQASFPFEPLAFAVGSPGLGAMHLALGREQP